MKGQNYLGIYISRNAATVVCLGSQGRDRNIQGCFSVSAEESEEPNLQVLANLISQGCAERELEFSEVAVALDCAMFMQHNVHSEFDDTKQIASTIRFDAEEALATDITEVAIAFKITSSNQTGSELAVFTAQRKVLSDILLSLQSNNIDPVTIEPDVNCLSRFISQNVSVPEDLRPLFAVLSRRNGYFIVPHLRVGGGVQKQSAVRTFLLSPAQSRTELLAREVPVTAGLVETDEPINCLKVFDSAGSVNCQQLSEKLGIETSGIDWLQEAAAESQTMADCADPADFAIAYGAALAHLEKVQSINFRNDFSPFQGKKVRLQRALKFASYSMVVLMLAVGLYFQLQLLQKNKYRNQLREKLGKEYSAIMLGKKPPAKIKDTVKALGTEKRRTESINKGLLSTTGKKSVSAKLTLMLKAFNKCAAQTKLNVDSISITTKAISIAGNTSSRPNTLRLRKEIEKTKLGDLKDSLETKGGRDNFRITIVPKK